VEGADEPSKCRILSREGREGGEGKLRLLRLLRETPSEFIGRTARNPAGYAHRSGQPIFPPPLTFQPERVCHPLDDKRRRETP